MKRTWWLAALAFAALACSSADSGQPSGKDGDKKDGKGTEVVLDGLKSIAPGTWKEEAPANTMRFKQFRLPKTGDDKDDAELVIFKGFGGTPKANIDRWKQQFIAPEGKTLDDVAKVSEFKVAGMPVSHLDISGTYLFKVKPIDPDSKAERRANYRMLAAHFEAKENIYHIKLTGPAKTVEQYQKGFEEWLKNFK